MNIASLVLSVPSISAIILPIKTATPADKFKISTIDGLGPTPIDLSLSNTLHSSAALQKLTPEKRVIVATVVLNPDFLSDESAGDLREQLYTMLSTFPGSPIGVFLRDAAGTVIATTTAYVSNIEINPFSKDPQVQITLNCLDSYFTATALTTVSSGTHQFAAITNGGSAPTGFIHTANFTLFQPSSYGSQYMGFANQSSGEIMEIGILYAPLGIPPGSPTYHADFKITIDTTAGERKVTVDNLTTAGFLNINLLPYLSAKSQFPQLYGGVNTLIWGPGGTYVNPAITNFTTKYNAKYWGV